jgi:hypothetical protein
MRPAPPRGAMFAQFWFVCTAFHDDSEPAVLWPGPMPSECPTWPIADAESDVPHDWGRQLAKSGADAILERPPLSGIVR